MSSQRDAEQQDVALERAEQQKSPEAQRAELAELTEIYVKKGLTPDLAKQVAESLTAHDVVLAHARDELGLTIDSRTGQPVFASPTLAAGSSFCSFLCGSSLPLLASAFIDDYITRLVTCIAVSTVGYVLLGALSASLGGASKRVGAFRVTAGGLVELGVTFAIGMAVGTGNA